MGSPFLSPAGRQADMLCLRYCFNYIKVLTICQGYKIPPAHVSIQQTRVIGGSLNILSQSSSSGRIMTSANQVFLRIISNLLEIVKSY